MTAESITQQTLCFWHKRRTTTSVLSPSTEQHQLGTYVLPQLPDLLVDLESRLTGHVEADIGRGD